MGPGMSFPEHVLLLNVFFSPYSYGGATVVAEEVAKTLVADHGRRVTAISAMTRTDLAPYATIKSETHGIANYLINLPPKRSYAEGYDNPRVTEIVARLVDDLAPDLVHAHCIQDLGAGVLPAIRDRGLPLILSVHDFWWLCERQFMIRPDQRYCGQDPIRIEACRGCVDDWPRARRRLERLAALAEAADLITYPSAFAQGLSERSGFGRGKGAIWENGVRPPGPGFFAAQAARRARDPRTVFGFVGGPSQIKGWPVMRAAFSQLARDDFAGLLVEGSLDGSWWRGRDLSPLKGDWRVYPRYGQDRIDDFYAEIDVLLFLSQWKETFGLTIREALARGIRVVQTASGGTTEWAGADPAQMLAIGDGPEPLARRIEAELARSERGAPPRGVTSYGDQAAAFLGLVAGLEPG